MGTMASTLAHELNQPLTAIINCLAGCERALDQKQIDRRELRGALERARSSADRAAETIRRIRLMVTKGEVIKEPVQISRSEEHTSELQSLMRISYAVFC